MGIETIVSQKKTICTITFQKVKTFSCDLLLWQTTPSDSEFGDLGGWFKRIPNNKILQIEASEGSWGIDLNNRQLGFFKPKSDAVFLQLDGVPPNFLDNTYNIFGIRGEGWIWMPPNPVDWRIFPGFK
ncbi:MAG: hypothetical protein JSS81_11680 [Acidobacteria bacterium]|nr:hypothetical protein [Acidobacteriota bacterium]